MVILLIAMLYSSDACVFLSDGVTIEVTIQNMSVSGDHAIQTGHQKGSKMLYRPASGLQCHNRGFKNLCIPAFADMPFGACLALTGFCPIMLNLISRCMLAGSSLSTDSSMLSVE